MPEPESFVMQDENGNDVNVEVVVKRIPIAAEGELENLLGKYAVSVDMQEFGGSIPSGSIRNLLLRHGVKDLRVGDRERKVNPNNPYPSLPDLRDDETGESIAERICQLIVRLKSNDWMLTNEAYGQVFRRYAPVEKEGEERENPTSTFTSTPSFGSGGEEKPLRVADSPETTS